MDMTDTILAKSDQITADDLLSGPRTITVSRVSGNEGNSDQPVNIFYEGDENRPFRPCKSMRRVMVKVWGVDAQKYVGRSLTLYNDPKVKWGGMEVGGVRISHMSHMDAALTVSLQVTRGKKAATKIQPLKMEAKPDKAQGVVDELLKRIASTDDLTEIENDETVIKQRKWLNQKRPELSQKIDDAINLKTTQGAE